ncbi:RteC domain-containing protein [Gaetbulibacter sp. M240]|uniref:RteC domain-containing protein n=1 Tax=Gaetbulibacter sp. M240 TaxID=3126511 RepID=UPI00374F3F8C
MESKNFDKSNMYFGEVNINSLPGPVKKEFEKILELYDSSPSLDDSDIIIANNIHVFQMIGEGVKNKEILIRINNNLLLTETSTIENGFEKIKFDNLTFYECKSEDYFDWFKSWVYDLGFIHGYKKEFKSDYEIFSTVFRKHERSLNLLEDWFDENYQIKVLNQVSLSIYGENEGKFARAWNEVLERPFDFLGMFEEFAEKFSDITPVEWKGTQTELIELTKALIEAGIFQGKQKEIFKQIELVFETKLNNIDKTISTFNNRNNDNETIFIDKLKESLLNSIRNKLEKNSGKV